MAFAVTNDFTGSTTLDATELDENFEDIENLANGGITAANLSATAGILNSQLATSNYELLVNLECDQDRWASTPAGEVVALCAIPGVSDTYTATYYAWSCMDVGSQDGQFRIEWGGFTGGGVNTWTNVTTIQAAVTMTSLAGNDTPSQGQGSLSVACAQDSSLPRWVALICVAAGTNTMNTSGSEDEKLVVTVKFQHALKA